MTQNLQQDEFRNDINASHGEISEVINIIKSNGSLEDVITRLKNVESLLSKYSHLEE